MPRGYYPRPSAIERFRAKVKVAPETGCHIWQAGRDKDGYGSFSAEDHRKTRAHRWIFEREVGPIPEGHVIDHLCRNPSCVNPEHLEAVRPYVNNVIRGVLSPTGRNIRKTHCKRGHPLHGDNLAYYIGRDGKRHRLCRSCGRVRSRRTYRQLRERLRDGDPEAIRQRERERAYKRAHTKGGVPNVLKTHCPQGHEYTPENTHINKRGWRDCRTCNREYQRRRRQQQAA